MTGLTFLATLLATFLVLYVAAWLAVIAPYIATLFWLGPPRRKHLHSCIRSYFRTLLRPRSWRVCRDYGQRNLRFYRMVREQAKQAYDDWQREEVGNP